MTILQGNNIDLLKTLPDNSVDSIVTDPPYGLSFMNKKWDYDVPSEELWREVYRVLKPGGHLLSFSGSRTYHRMAVRIEDAGFEIRDQIMWIYGSGFPKSHNIGKAIDKRGGESIGWFGQWLKEWREENNIPQSKIAELFPSKTGGLTGCVSNWEIGYNLPTNEQFNLICETFDLPFNSLEEAEREYIGTKTSGIGKAFTKDGWGSGHDEVEITKGQSEWEGWGTALKPAHEPIVVARKPLSEKSVAENVLRWGTGGINIDDCRIATDDNLGRKNTVKPYNDNNGWNKNNTIGIETHSHPQGRWPANIMFDEYAAEVLDQQTGEVGNGWKKNYGTEDYVGKQYDSSTQQCEFGGGYSGINTYCDTGGASRFFYCAKASKKDKDEGLDNMEDKVSQLNSGGIGRKISVEKRLEENGENAPTVKNNHPTVKPTKLMEYLIKLITPKNGVVLDPFMGSGSTGKAAVRNGFDFIGMELDEEYYNIAKVRIEYEFNKSELNQEAE